MRNRIIVGILVIVLAGVIVLFAKNLAFNRTIKGQLRENAADGLFLAEQMYKEGNWDKAKGLYEKVLFSQTDLKKAQEIKHRIEEINLKLLFSPVIDANSTQYVVQKGDFIVKIAQKFNTTPELIKKANNLTSNIIRIGEKLKVTTLTFAILVTKSGNQLFLKTGETLFKTYTVSTGKNNCSPVGKFKIINKIYNPTWFKAGAAVPPNSPNNILGTRWMGIDVAGYGIHGTTEPEMLGQQATAGCVRMRNDEVEELFDIVPVGTEVTIVD